MAADVPPVSGSGDSLDPAVVALRDLLRGLVGGGAAGEGGSAGEGSAAEEALDAARKLAAELTALRTMKEQIEARLNGLLEVVLAVAALDYSVKAAIIGDGDLLDALAGGLNMMTEDLHAAMSDVRRQAAALMEMSTPLIPIANGVVALPLVGSVDAARAQQIIEALLRGVVAHRADVAILDITGVTAVDADVASGVLRAVRAAQLIGARVVLTGVRPEVARTLVGLDIDMSGVLLRGTLKDGIAAAQAMRR